MNGLLYHFWIVVIQAMLQSHQQELLEVEEALSQVISEAVCKKLNCQHNLFQYEYILRIPRNLTSVTVTEGSPC